MYAENSAEVADILIRSGRVPAVAMAEAEESHRSTGRSLAAILVSTGAIAREALLEEVAKELGLAYCANPPSVLDGSAMQLLTGRLAHRYGAAPLGETEGRLQLLVADPFNHHVIDDLTFTLARPVEVLVADPEHIRRLIESAYGAEREESIEETIAELAASADSAAATETDAVALGERASEEPVIRLVDLILTQAIRDGASDIHFEPFEDVFQVRYRIAGALFEMAPPPRNLALPVISRLKVLADLDIAEQRVPQDGRIKVQVDGRPVDLRVSTLPTEFGESVVLRVLDKSVVNLDLGSLGMPEDVLTGVREVARRPNGIFIVTGPTGSGKTTTLYSALREVNDVDTKILTAEDPVEYEIEGLVQTAINAAVGLTFASALRSFLRQDPDKILVGEIRDLETARIAVQASLTGHLVMSTLHTNDAPGAVTRLLDMGVEPFLIAASLEAVLAQRLVRAVCPRCRQEFAPEARMIASLGLNPEQIGGRTFAAGTGCPECHESGYRGRLGLFEWMPIDEGMRQLVTDRVPTPELRKRALQGGMRTLRDDGIRAILDHRTTVAEVLSYT